MAKTLLEQTENTLNVFLSPSALTSCSRWARLRRTDGFPGRDRRPERGRPGGRLPASQCQRWFVGAANGALSGAYVDKNYIKCMEPDATITALDALQGVPLGGNTGPVTIELTDSRQQAP